MPIYCSVHHDKPAVFLCRECGFLCQEHAESEGERGHTAVFVGPKMKELYNEMALLERTNMLSKFALLIKKEVASAMDNNANMLLCEIDMHNAKVANLTTDKSIAGINQIGKFVKESFKFDQSINVSNEINQLCESIKSNIEKSIELSKKSFMANDPSLMIANAEIGKCPEKLSKSHNTETIITQCIPDDCTSVGII